MYCIQHRSLVGKVYYYMGMGMGMRHVHIIHISSAKGTRSHTIYKLYIVQQHKVTKKKIMLARKTKFGSKQICRLLETRNATNVYVC